MPPCDESALPLARNLGEPRCQEKWWMGVVGEYAAEVQWQIGAFKNIYNFSRGVFLKGASGAAHALLLELQAKDETPNRPRRLHLLHCPCVHADFQDVASKEQHWQPLCIPEAPRPPPSDDREEVRDVPISPREGREGSPGCPDFSG